MPWRLPTLSLWGKRRKRLCRLPSHWNSPERVSLLRPSFLFSVPPEWRLRMGSRSPCPPQVFGNTCWSPQFPTWLFLLSRGLAACAQTPRRQREGWFAKLIWPKSWEAVGVPEEVSDMMMELGTWHLVTHFFLLGLVNMSWEIYWVSISQIII